MDEVAVGDLSSSARGTGARKNLNKPQWWQIPWWAVDEAVVLVRGGRVHSAPSVDDIIVRLAVWQRGNDLSLHYAIAELAYLLAEEHRIAREPHVFPWHAFISTAAVLEFGAKKYPACPENEAIDSTGRPTPASAGNWAKGMPWSVCFACAISHLTKRSTGELFDEESGVLHLAHAMCNLLFLSAYQDLYPEGDDRISAFRVGGVPPSRPQNSEQEFDDIPF